MPRKEIEIKLVIENEDEERVIKSIAKWYYTNKIPMENLFINDKSIRAYPGNEFMYKSHNLVTMW